MGLIGKHLGKIGDLCYALPACRELGITTLYIPERTAESPAIYSTVKDFLLLQPCIKEVKEYPSNLGYGELAPGIHIDIDLDLHRTHPYRGKTNMVQRYFEIFNIKGVDPYQPWLTIDRPFLIPFENKYCVINLTNRFRDNSLVDWKRIRANILKEYGTDHWFVGTEAEHADFERAYGKVNYMKTPTVLDLARFIAGAEEVYCNQSLCLVIAQGLGKVYHLEKKPTKTNVLFYTKNENVLK